MIDATEIRLPGAPYAMAARQFISEFGSFVFGGADSEFPIARVFELFPINILDQQLKGELLARGAFKKDGERVVNSGAREVEAPFFDQNLGPIAITFPAVLSALVVAPEDRSSCTFEFQSTDNSNCVAIAIADPPDEMGISSIQVLRAISFDYNEVRYSLEALDDSSRTIVLIVDFLKEFPDSFSFNSYRRRGRASPRHRLQAGPANEEEPPWWLGAICFCLFKNEDGQPKPPEEVDRCDSAMCVASDCMTKQEASDRPGLFIYTGWFVRNIFTFYGDPTSLVGKICKIVNLGSCPYPIEPGEGAKPVYYEPTGRVAYLEVRSVRWGYGYLYNSFISGVLTSTTSATLKDVVIPIAGIEVMPPVVGPS